MALRKEQLDILVCPQCKGDVVYIEQDCQLVCYHCKLVFVVKNDIPVMLIEEAQTFKES